MSGLSRIIRLTGLKGDFKFYRVTQKVIADISHNIEGFTELIAQIKHLNHINYILYMGQLKEEI